MYLTKTDAGRGYTVMYPEFEGEGCGTVNQFYETLAESAVQYFESLVAEDRHTVCRGTFSVTDGDDAFTVRITLTLRKSGRRCGEKILEHRWKRWEGRDAVLEKGKKREFP